MSKSQLSPAFRAVHDTLASHDLARALRPHLAKARWAEVVGPQVAGVTQVERVQTDGAGKTVLVVRVKNSVWANELTLLKGDMLRRLNLALGGQVLTDMHFKASGLAKKGNRAKMPAQTPSPDPDTLGAVPLPRAAQERIQAAAAGIADDTLRAKITHSMQRAARADEWKRQQGWTPCPRCGTLTESIPCALCRALTPR